MWYFFMKDKYRRNVIITGLIALTLIGIISYIASADLYGGFVITSGGIKKLPIYCVDTKNPQVALSFDAAWGNDDTKEILQILEEENVKATFFMTGEWIEKYPNDVKELAKAGHDLANHGMNHKEMSKLSREECEEEILMAHELVKKLTGIEMTLFRPPYGETRMR